MGQSVSQVDPISREEAASPRKGSKATEATSDSSKPSKRLGLHGPEMGEPADDPASEFDARAPAHSVVFLLHSGQPLSYVASLIEAEGPGFGDEVVAKDISFHSRRYDSKRWSPATSIGDFLRDAARIGSFVIRLNPKGTSSSPSDIEPRNIFVSVPSFEDRTRYLRSTLYAKTYEIERMVKLKGECDALARVGTRRFAFGGAAILGAWWIAVAYGTFFTEYSWDLLEPVTYLTGLGVFMCGYVWFLVHNREVSYRAVLSETTTRRQQKLYIQKGFNLERYEDLIDECKELRKHIKRVAEDYDLEWEQGKGSSGHNKRALDIVRKREAQDRAPKVIKTESEEEEQEGDEGVSGSDEEEQKKKEESGSR
ncbi:hypothetical protein FA10DRAFT_260324 [Acaromyces ingoldii]|uniref:Calcium uniporter protein, mitochondrial n=1 Tax=Acaromyces ingoldii TaxID=215250 RepID=A0A316YPB3_9BASI|nr:hypothetical protein FA10DRAFT_260324 [Acaromyces ingoldii]PWN90498.1 hypothetical protein FA10DRAFT_260324 [Acaromyces ingoldii]